MKAYLDVTDIAERYQVSRDKAYSIIRAIKFVSDGYTLPGKRPKGALPGAKVLQSELKKWEDSYGMTQSFGAYAYKTIQPNKRKGENEQ